MPNKEMGAGRAASRLALLFLVFSLIGFLDSSYLAAKHFLGGIVPCSFGNCEQVLNSPYSLIFGIPVALLGAIYYLIFFGATILYFDTKKTAILKYLSFYSIAGLAASLWFVYTQLFIIHSICEFCILSAASSTLLFISGMVYLSKSKKIAV